VTDRGLPIADGAPACPFVAFEDDRDERGSVPDHRHRCYAEARPTPRALAHQQAYCLSSAFPVCPTFQDWARREAARARDGLMAAGPTPKSASEDRAAATRADASGDAEGSTSSDDGDEAGRRPRNSAAVAASAAASAATAMSGSSAAQASAEPSDGRRGSGTADGVDREDGWDGSDDERDGDARTDDGVIRRNPPRDWAAPPPWLASAEVAGRDGAADPPAFLGRRMSEPGAGLAGSAADRLAGGGSTSRAHDDLDLDPPFAPARGGRSADLAGDDDAARLPARRPRAYAQHLGGPEGPDWERPRRFEAYPTIRTRIVMPHLPRVVLMAGAVGVLAIALFFLPGILGLGGNGGGTPGASNRASNAPQATASPAPSTQAAATPILYTIRKNDTLLKIATAHGVTLEELLAANPSIKNPNKIAEGQQITLPPPDASVPDTFGGSPGPSKTP
jgi:LysM domain-containing protein